jgi:TatD DNase family protein
VCVSEGLADAQRVLALAAAQPMIRPCLGLHPERADLEEARALEALARAQAAVLVGVGEVGLDYWLAQDEAGRAVQRQVLAIFVALARELDLPLNVHSRSAGHHTIAFLREQGAVRVLMHAFDGKASHALAGVEAGYVFSVPPSVVRSPQKQKLVRRLPLTHLLLETDSPVLGPTREARNEPANAAVSARAIAEIKGCRVEEVLEATTANARQLFRL